LEALFNEVIIPSSVFDELNIAGKPESQQIVNWSKGKVIAASNRQLVYSFNLLLGMGE